MHRLFEEVGDDDLRRVEIHLLEVGETISVASRCFGHLLDEDLARVEILPPLGRVVGQRALEPRRRRPRRAQAEEKEVDDGAAHLQHEAAHRLGLAAAPRANKG